ncbi:MAG TPA: DUF6702 family protein [Chitinophagaceae bacterium]
MAATFYKWLLVPFLGLFLSKPADSRWHPFHVSVVEINHNPSDKNLEISSKIFTDDFERVLAQNYKTKVDLINPPDRKAVDKLIEDYIKTHLIITADGKPTTLKYLGFEREDDAIFSYVEVEGIPAVKKLDIVNRIMYDYFDDQTNLLHVVVGGARKSTKLEFPVKEAQFLF